jgi:hypothetical protein
MIREIGTTKYERITVREANEGYDQLALTPYNDRDRSTDVLDDFPDQFWYK